MNQCKSLVKKISNFFWPPPPPQPPRGYFHFKYRTLGAIVLFVILSIFLTQLEQATGRVSKVVDDFLSNFFGDQYLRWDRRSDFKGH